MSWLLWVVLQWPCRCMCLFQGKSCPDICPRVGLLLYSILPDDLTVPSQQLWDLISLVSFYISVDEEVGMFCLWGWGEDSANGLWLDWLGSIIVAGKVVPSGNMEALTKTTCLRKNIFFFFQKKRGSSIWQAVLYNLYVINPLGKI